MKAYRSNCLAGACFSALMGLSVLPGQAVAQTADGGSRQATQIDDIIVTAQRRSQSLQEVPISITAVTREVLDDAAIRGVEEIAARAPSFTMTAFNIGQPRLYIRGAGSQDDGAAQDNSVAIFVDDVYVARGAGQAFEFLDIERVEVLRGPQGTLYGKNITGGLINIISARPQSEFDAAAEVSYGNYNAIDVRGFVTGPIADRLDGSLSVVRRTRDGFSRNIVRNEDLEDLDLFAVRGQLAYMASENLELRLAADYNRHHDNGQSRKGEGPFGATPFGSVTAVMSSTDPRESESPRKTFQNRSVGGIMGRADWAVGPGTLTSISAYRASSLDLGDAFTGIGSPPYAVLDTLNTELEEANQFSQEVRYAFDGLFGGRLLGVAGLYYLKETVDRTEIADLISVIGSRIPSLGGLTGISASYQDAETASRGAFASANWKFTETLSATAGIRYTTEDKDIRTRVVSLADTDAIIAAPPSEAYDVSAAGSWDGWSPRVSLEWAPIPTLNFYVSYSEGFKSGGFQGQAPRAASARVPFNPEYAASTEIGAKGRLFDGRLGFALAAFSTDYTDLQVRQNSQLPSDPLPVLRITNAGEAKATGWEVELTAAPTEGLEMWASYGALDAEYVRLIDNTGANRAGNRMIFSPESTYNIGAQITVPLAGSHEFYGRVEYRWQDTFFYDPANNPVNTQGDYGLLSGAMGVKTIDGRLGFELYGKNLTDELYTTHVIPFLGDRFATYGPPATYGVRVRWNY